METRRREGWSRRGFLGGLALAGTVGLSGVGPRPATAEPPPETTRIRLGRSPSICYAPTYVAEELLRAEGFTEIEYVVTGSVAERSKALAAGRIDLSQEVAAPLLLQIDAGDPIVVLTGLHVGCYELFGNDRVRAIRDLKGKRVGVQALGVGPHVLLSAMAAYVGLDPRKDINWVTGPGAESMQAFVAGKIDAFMAFPPEPQELRGRKIGHVVVDTAVDRPWSQQFCCMLAGHREFVRTRPVAAKRALRAILKAVEVCAREPERVARLIVDKGYASRYDYALQALKEIPFTQWREYDPESTLRFHALRLHEVGMIKSNPKRIIAQGTDWRLLTELKRELKG